MGTSLHHGDGQWWRHPAKYVVTLTVTAAASFTLSAAPASLTVQQGSQGTSTITSTISGGFNAAVTLSAAGTPAGTTISFVRIPSQRRVRAVRP